MQLINMRRQSGIGMVELILGLAVLGAVLSFVLRQQSNADSQTLGRARADAIASFQQLAGQFFIANRNDIEAAMGGDATKAAEFCLINVATDGTGGTVTMNATKHTCAIDSTLLRAKGQWPNGQNHNATSVNRYVAIYRQIMTTDTTPVPTGASEMLVVMAQLDSSGNVMTSGSVSFSGDKARAMQEAKAAMDALGGTGGYIPPGSDTGPCKYNGTVKQVCGNGWIVSLSDFL